MNGLMNGLMKKFYNILYKISTIYTLYTNM